MAARALLSRWAIWPHTLKCFAKLSFLTRLPPPVVGRSSELQTFWRRRLRRKIKSETIQVLKVLRFIGFSWWKIQTGVDRAVGRIKSENWFSLKHPLCNSEWSVEFGECADFSALIAAKWKENYSWSEWLKQRKSSGKILNIQSVSEQISISKTKASAAASEEARVIKIYG